MATPIADTNSKMIMAAEAREWGQVGSRGLHDPRNEHDGCGIGFVAHLKGEKSHQIVRDGLSMLNNLTHRGAVGADPLTGDGAGILVQIPDRFFREEMAKQGVILPKAGEYAVGYLFMPRDEASIAHLKEVISEVVAEEGQILLGFRDVPVDNSSLSKAPEIAATEPHHVQVFIGAGREAATKTIRDGGTLRKVISNRIYAEADGGLSRFLYRVTVDDDHRLQGNVPRLSCRTLLQGPRRRTLPVGGCARTPALLDQHLPVLGARAGHLS